MVLVYVLVCVVALFVFVVDVCCVDGWVLLCIGVVCPLLWCGVVCCCGLFVAMFVA